MAKEQPKSVALAYFSGTGCTEAAADCFARHFAKQGVAVNAIPIPREGPDSAGTVQGADLLLILSPVYAFRLASIVEQWAGRLPFGNGKPAAIIAVSGGGEISPNTACRVFTKRTLTKRHYRVIYETMLVMPSNCLAATATELAVRLINILPHKAKAVIDDLLAGREQLLRPLIRDRAMAALGRLEHPGARLFGATIHASETCVHCGACVADCPTGNIRLEGGRIKCGFTCILCLKCLYACPARALSPRLMKCMLLKDGFSMEKLREAAALGPRQELTELPPGLLWRGVRAYLNEDRD